MFGSVRSLLFSYLPALNLKLTPARCFDQVLTLPSMLWSVLQFRSISSSTHVADPPPPPPRVPTTASLHAKPSPRRHARRTTQRRKRLDRSNVPSRKHRRLHAGIHRPLELPLPRLARRRKLQEAMRDHHVPPRRIGLGHLLDDSGGCEGERVWSTNWVS